MNSEDWEETLKKIAKSIQRFDENLPESIWSMVGMDKAISRLHHEMARRELAKRIGTHRFSAN